MYLRRLLYPILFLLCVDTFAQKGLYPLTIIAKDERSGSQFNANYTVKSIKTGVEVKVEYNNNYAIAYCPAGDKYQIIAVSEGYSNKTETISIELDADPKDPRTKNISMTPRASAYIMVKAVDEKTGEPIPANFKLVMVSTKKNYDASTTKEKIEQKVIVSGDNAKDEVEVMATATNYESKSEKLSIEVKDPAQNFPIVLKLKKSDFKIKIKAVDNRDKAIPRTKYIVREVGAVNPVINVLDPPTGDITITLSPEKNYRLNIEAPGYNTVDRTFLGNEAVLNQTIRLVPKFEAFFKIKAMSNGKRIPATIRVSSSKIGQIGEILDSDTTSTVKITEQGIFKVEVIAKGYQTAIDDIMVEAINAGVTTEKIIELEKGIKEYIIKLVDDEKKEAILFGDLKLKTSAGVLVKATKNIQTNDWTVVLQEDAQYTIEAFAPEYRSVKQNIKQPTGKQIEIQMSRLTASMNLTAIDAYTKKPIAAQFKVARPESSPLEGKTQADGSRFKFEMLPGQKYKVAISSTDYQPKSEDISLNSDGKGDTKIFELVKNSYPFHFKVFDIQTNKSLSDVKFKIINNIDNQEVKVYYQEKAQEREAEFVLSANYEIEVLAEGYEPSKTKVNPQDLINEDFKKDIFMTKKAIELFRISVKDEANNAIIKDVDLKILVNSKLVETTKSPDGNEWLLPFDDKKEYIVDAKAEGYEAIRQPILKKAGNQSTEVLMKKIPQQEVTVLVVDALSKKPLEVNFKLTVDKETINSKGSTLKTILRKDKNYSIEASAEGYNTSKYTILSSKVSAEPYIISMTKLQYIFAFKAIDVNSKAVLNDVKISVKNLTKNQEVKTKELQRGEVSVELKPEFTYEVSAEMKGYDNATIKVDAAMFIGQNFNNEIPMSFRKEPLPAAVKRIEPPKVEPKPEPKPEPVKKVENFESLSVGKVIMLDNVYFDQASYVLKNESVPQLDKLANTLKSNPKLKIEIVGHTSDEGDKRLNQNLSIFRAKVIANYLFNKGIAENRISTNGYGSDKPIVKNGTDDEKKQNRRVEVIVKEF
jgi:outer membrane protein OmpA-like peptidoglycan-associated protein